MRQPFFSIITVCFNSEKTIERTLKSVLAQSYMDYEYIIVDGASKDYTIDIIKQYEHLFDGRMIWSSEPDKGIYDAFNKGCKKAKGEYLWIVNSDDYLEQDSLITVWDVIKKSESSFSKRPIISGSMNFRYKDGSIAYTKQLLKDEALYRVSIEDIGINHPATLVPKEVYERIGYYDDKYAIMADMDWFTRAYRVGECFLWIPDVLTNMTDGGVSTKLNFRKICKDRWYFSHKVHSTFCVQIYYFCKWISLYLKSNLKSYLVKYHLYHH